MTERGISRGLIVVEQPSDKTQVVNDNTRTLFTTPEPPIINDGHNNAEIMATGKGINIHQRKVRQYSEPGGSVETSATVKSTELVFKNLFGDTSDGSITNGGNAVTGLSIKQYDATEKPAPLQVQVSSDQVGTAETSGWDIYTGGQIEKATINLNENNEVRTTLDFKMIGKLFGIPLTDTSYTENIKDLASQAVGYFSPYESRITFANESGSFTANDTKSLNVKSGTVEVMREREYSHRMGTDDTLLTHSIMVSGTLEVEGDKEFLESLSDKNDYRKVSFMVKRGDTLGDVLTVGSNTIDLGTSEIKEGLYLILDRVGINIDSVSAGTNAETTRTISFTAYADGSTTGINAYTIGA